MKQLKYWLLSLVLFVQVAFAVPVEIANAPQNSLALTVSALERAKSKVYINIYELTSAQVTDAILAALKRGVQVEMLVEGQPVGGLTTVAKGIQGQIAKAMANGKRGHLYMMRGKMDQRRFRFNHAKYIIVDDEQLLIGSENYSPGGQPEDGAPGNRGWEVLVRDAALAKSFKEIFLADSDKKFGDVVELTARNTTGEGFTAGEFTAEIPTSVDIAELMADTAYSRARRTGGGGAVYEASSVKKITSPDTSLKGLLALIKSAKKSLYIEQMTFDSGWKNSAYDRSPLIDAVLDAARRGVEVRVLLNDETSFSNGAPVDNPKNLPTVDIFNKAARRERLPLEARTANLQAMGVNYIHNKGVIVDGKITLISSINWGQNSIENNREAAVAITGREIAEYYTSLFQDDWEKSAIGRMDFGIGENEIFDFDLDNDFVGINECPQNLKVLVAIGALSSTDPSFSALSNQKLEQNFVLSEDTLGCVYTQADLNVQQGDRKFLELKTRSNGTKQIIFEGYTEKTRKVYSVRTSGKVDLWIGQHSAIFYESVGGARRKLGEASIELAVPDPELPAPDAHINQEK
jgi:phosphatidylserine/phosphatidylglycerophosphate/cardiolipin synthase-like enzyme